MSDSPANRQWPEPDPQSPSPQSYALSGRIMLASIIVLFVVVVLLVLLHLYARWYLLRLHVTRRRNRNNRRTRVVFYVDNNPPPPTHTGLEPSVLKSLPVFVYSPRTHENAPECAVCLSEFVEHETGRVLPKCKHSFHTECIDMWFGSHSTCPLCRTPVEAVEMEIKEINETTSFQDRMKRVDVRIDVPNRTELAAEIELQLTSPSQGYRSPGGRLLSLKRIINMSRRSPAVSPSAGAGTSGPSGPSCVVPVGGESDAELTQSQESKC